MTHSLIVKLGRNLFARLELGPNKPIHDLYAFALGAYVMILLSSLLNTIVQKYHLARNGRMDWLLIKSYLTEKIRKVHILFVLNVKPKILLPLNLLLLF
jgi:hypothetical protein